MNKNILNSVPIENQKRNTFDLSHDLKFSFNMGKLVPTTVIDVVPGDSFTIGFENMLRFSALIAPIMHRVKVTTHYFFVPNRIIWPNWERWITGQLDVEPPYFIPNDSFTKYYIGKGSLADYMGLPPDQTLLVDKANGPKINALPFAAYWKIWNEYYQDQNLDPDFENFSPMWEMSDGNNTENEIVGSSYYLKFGAQNSLKNLLGDRAWQHDYFTSALPFTQKGEDVFIPLSDMPVAPLEIAGVRQPLIGKRIDTGANLAASSNLLLNASSQFIGNTLGYLEGQVASNDGGTGDGTILNLRRAFKLQEWLEKNARGGTRYTESILIHFGVKSPDQRLQRPEYLGGSVQNMVISEVLSTAQTLDSADEVVNPVGQMSGHAISVGGSRVLNYYAQEHGWIIGLISVMPDTAYQDGIARKFDRTDIYEYFWPSFQHIGDQAIKNQEVKFNPNTPVENQNTFGYVPRYSEYKYENSRVAGDFRDSLDFWHLGRKFVYLPEGDQDHPVLNDQFIYPWRVNTDIEEQPFDRIFAVNSSVADTIYAHVLNKIKAKRPMAYYGLPGL